MLDHKTQKDLTRMTREKIDGLETWVTAFLRDCKTRGLSAFTIEFYRAQLQIFITYCKGESVTDTQWHTVVAWGPTAEQVERLLRKGMPVMLEGNRLALGSSGF